MSGQLQLRRGSTAENDAFTGVEGELTYDTVKKELRIHDGVTQGGNKVPTLVAVQRPTAENNYTWYRKWSDGWVEQGGKGQVTTKGTGNTFSLPVAMVDTNYTIVVAKWAGDTGNVGFNAEPDTTTTFRAGVAYGANLTRSFTWQVSGIAAE